MGGCEEGGERDQAVPVNRYIETDNGRRGGGGRVWTVGRRRVEGGGGGGGEGPSGALESPNVFGFKWEMGVKGEDPYVAGQS